MHDPLTVAFTIRSPWPQHSALPAAGHRSIRWRIRLHHDCGTWCADDPQHPEGAFPWWQLSSYSAFWRLNGKDYYFPSLITVWHREPGGRDSLSTCGKRVQRRDGTWGFTRGWRWHVHHWRLQCPPLQRLRRRLLTRCAWCHSRHRPGDAVNISHSWDGPSGHWWQGEPGLFHRDCSAIERAHASCACEHPVLDQGDYGRCARCLHHRSYATGDEQLARTRQLARISLGGRDPDRRSR